MSRPVSTHSAGGANEAAGRLRKNGQYAARVQDILNKCYDRIQILTERRQAEVRGSADELKQGVLAWGQAVLAPQYLLRLEGKAHSPIASRLETLADEVDDLNLGDRIHWPVGDQCRTCVSQKVDNEAVDHFLPSRAYMTLQIRPMHLKGCHRATWAMCMGGFGI